MALADYTFRDYEFDGDLLVHSILPPRIIDSELSVVAWQFLEHYETSHRIAVLNDYRAVENLSETARTVLRALIETSLSNPRFIAAVWVVGSNATIAEQIRSVLTTLRLDSGLVVEEHDEAIALLRRFGVKIPDGFCLDP